MEGQQRSMLHADGPQGGAIDLHKSHTQNTTVILKSVELLGLTSAKDKKSREITVAKMRTVEQVFIVLHLI